MRAQSIIAVVIAFAIIAAPTPAAAVEPDVSAPAGIESTSSSETLTSAAASTFEAERALILQQTNALRATNGLPPLRLNPALNEIAQDWSTQQARAATMSHRPDFTAMYPAGWSRAAENVAAGYSPSAVVGAWAGSAGHRANMLSSNTDIGIGIAATSTGRLYYTQNFGRYGSTPPVPPGAVSRLAGDDRFSTSVQVSVQAFPGGATTVYIASGLDFPDALSAAALAGAANGPLLLVQPGSVPAVVLAELRRLRPDRIVVAGGPGVISDAVVATLRTVASSVTRVSGVDRYDTSRSLARHVYAVTGAPVVYLATGAGFADALAAGPAAAVNDAPVVLVPGTESAVDSETLALLQQLRTSRVVIVGGTGVVSDGIARSLIAADYVVERLAGSDRYSTAALIASSHFPSSRSSYISTGTGFADALSGGAAAGALGAPLFTSLATCVPPAAYSALIAQDPDQLLLLGGFGALQPTVAGFYRC